jgi:hypothetical protein
MVYYVSRQYPVADFFTQTYLREHLYRRCVESVLIKVSFELAWVSMALGRIFNPSVVHKGRLRGGAYLLS